MAVLPPRIVNPDLTFDRHEAPRFSVSNATHILEPEVGHQNPKTKEQRAFCGSLLKSGPLCASTWQQWPIVYIQPSASITTLSVVE